MTTTRFLPGVLLAVLGSAGPAAAQYGLPPYSPPGRSPAAAASGQPDAGLQPYRPPAPAASLERMTTQAPAAEPDPVGTLTGQPAQLVPPGPGGPGLPPGAYAGPYLTDRPGCCGPLGGGHLAYELYAMTGPNFVFGNPALTDRLRTGWIVQGGGRSLIFNSTNDAAWVVDLGLSYQYNRGSQDDPADLFIRQPNVTQTSGTTQVSLRQPDLLLSTNIRALHRTTFNFALGRDWWLWGPGAPGLESGWNVRWGMELGGRWGTEHVDLDLLGTTGPLGSPLYARRQGVTHGIFVGTHANVERCFGGWVWFAGLRAQYGYDWGNVVAPLNGDVQNFNLLMETGIRF